MNCYKDNLNVVGNQVVKKRTDDGSLINLRAKVKKFESIKPELSKAENNLQPLK